MLRLEITSKGKDVLEKALLAACWEIADRIFAMAQSNLATKVYDMDGYSSVITDTGELLGSGSVERTTSGAKVKFESSHANSVEWGMLPGVSVPVEPIAEWARRKLGIKEKDAMGIAWAIRQKILEEGTTSRPFLRDACYSVIAEYYSKKVKA